MNYSEAQTFFETDFREPLMSKFLESYPDIFVNSRTLDKEVYRNSNPCMYSWFIFIANKVSFTNLSPKYRQTEDEFYNSDWSCVKRFVEDFKSSKDWQSFLFENTKINY